MASIFRVGKSNNKLEKADSKLSDPDGGSGMFL
jgi:hypothetical protein